MPSLVLILGTAHSIQVGSKREEPRCIDSFRKFLLSTVHANQVGGIAEEMSTDALPLYGCQASVAELLSNELGLLHLYADPVIAEQSQMGIVDDTHSKWRGIFQNLPTEQVDREIQNQHQARERYWLEKLQSFPPDRVIFICGSDHVSSFYRKVADHGIQVKTIDPNWQPNHSMHSDGAASGPAGDAGR